MTDIATALGIKIRARRKALGIAQDRLANLATIDRSYVGRIERGEVDITLVKLYKLAATLDCKVFDLLPTDEELAMVCQNE